jgi:hypothetical protein
MDQTRGHITSSKNLYKQEIGLQENIELLAQLDSGQQTAGS